jgi:amino acid adenylation domain-containing protein
MTEARTPAAATTVDALIGAALSRFGDGVAVYWAGSEDTAADADRRTAMTYSELESRSRAMAGELVSRGVKPGNVVGICLPRGREQVVALLGILRAGAAVLPLDPAYPRMLLAHMLADSAAGMVITHRQTDGVLPEGGAERLLIGDGRDGVFVENVLPGRESSNGRDSLCYVLYTSGSTGRPKGVAMPHRAMLNLLEWQRGVMPLAPAARVLQFAPLSFDVSFQEFFSTLADGGTLILVDEDVRRDPRALWKVIAEEQVERVFLPYVSLQALAEQAPEDLPGSLRDVITAGEQLRITPQIRALFSRLQNVRLHNHYGPTETHVCTSHTLPTAASEWPLLPSIGQPITGTEVLLIDEQGEASDEGELHVGGACLADGYFRRADLTAERFVTIAGHRFYRTGDLARRGADGALEYLGRADEQLKVRGFRVEPGEIEAQLSDHPAVRECAVTARDQRLLAYWVGEDAEPGALRAFLASRIAEHLIPAFFTRVDTMPLTASGKINRRALPNPELPAEFAFQARPAAGLETTIARIWSDVLRLPSVPRNVNFGDLGGTSLHAAEVQAALGRELQRELSVTQLHEYPTVAALARALEGIGTGASLGERAQSRAASQRAALKNRARANRLSPHPADV